MTKKSKEKLILWLLGPTTGASAKAMVRGVLGLPQEDYLHLPRDLWDFERCQTLLREVPEIRDHFEDIAKVSKPWERFTQSWHKIEELFRASKYMEARQMIDECFYSIDVHNHLRTNSSYVFDIKIRDFRIPSKKDYPK